MVTPAAFPSWLITKLEAAEYTFEKETGINEVQLIFDASLTEKAMICVRDSESKPHGTGMRFDAYGYFHGYPEELLSFLSKPFD